MVPIMFIFLEIFECVWTKGRVYGKVSGNDRIVSHKQLLKWLVTYRDNLSHSTYHCIGQ